MYTYIASVLYTVYCILHKYSIIMSISISYQLFYVIRYDHQFVTVNTAPDKTWGPLGYTQYVSHSLHSREAGIRSKGLTRCIVKMASSKESPALGV